MCLHRRNGKVGLSGMAIADITLLSGFHALRADLEKVWPDTQRPLCPREPCAVPAAPQLLSPSVQGGPGLPPCDQLPFPTVDLPL